MGKLQITITKNIQTGQYPEEGELQGKIIPMIQDYLKQSGYEAKIQIVENLQEKKKMKYSAKLEKLADRFRLKA